ncbi:MAG: ATP-binding protein [Gemmatimonadaceae bacterium]
MSHSAGAAPEATRALFEQSPFSTVVYDTAGRVLAVNAAFERLFGLAFGDIPRDYSVLADAQLAQQGFLPAVRRAFAGEAVVLPVVHYDPVKLVGAGTRSWTQGHFFPVRDGAGAVTGVVLVHVDLTARVEAEEARRAADEAHAMRLRDQAAELEAQQAELERQTEELQAINEELHETNDALDAARRDAERAEAYVRGILGSISDPLVVQDAEWRFRYVNDAAAAALAQSGRGGPDALLGRVVWEVYPELVGTPFEREMRHARDACVPVELTALDARSNRWSELRCYPMPGGGLATLWRDVTERKHAEEARHYLARASEILAASLDRDETARQLTRLLVPKLADWCSIQLVDERGELRQVAVAHVEPAKVAWAEELHRRYPPDPEAHSGAHEVMRTGQPILLREIPDELLVAGARDDEHLRILRGIGFSSALVVPLAARGHVLGAMSLVAAESGRRYGEPELALVRELAERAALAIDNAALYGAAVRARDEASHANRAKADFLASMSHELRTPLNAIGGYADLLLDGVRGPISDVQRADVERIKRSQRHLLGLINDILNFAKVEAGRVQLELRDVSMNDALGQLEGLVAPQLREKELRYEYRCCDASFTAHVDPERLQQVFLNLLSNAVKFTPSGGSILVECDATPDAMVVSVQDTGVGIPPEKLEAIFEPFVQLDRGQTPGSAGTGLGLAISRDLARAMGGELVARSTPGAGSTFVLTLPRRAPGARAGV